MLFLCYLETCHQQKRHVENVCWLPSIGTVIGICNLLLSSVAYVYNIACAGRQAIVCPYSTLLSCRPQVLKRGVGFWFQHTVNVLPSAPVGKPYAPFSCRLQVLKGGVRFQLQHCCVSVSGMLFCKPACVSNSSLRKRAAAIASADTVARMFPLATMPYAIVLLNVNTGPQSKPDINMPNVHAPATPPPYCFITPHITSPPRAPPLSQSLILGRAVSAECEHRATVQARHEHA